MQATNVYKQTYLVTPQDREKLNNHNSFVIWFTGLSCSGKTTLANHLEYDLHKKGYRTFSLDGDNVRQGLNKNLGFSREDREENIRRIAEVAKLMNDAGIIVLTAFISPFIQDRENAKKIIGEDKFVEVYCKCALEECITRDVKGLYKKAIAGQIKEFTGITQAYEEPINPFLIIETDKSTVAESIEKISLALLTKRYFKQ